MSKRSSLKKGASTRSEHVCGSLLFVQADREQAQAYELHRPVVSIGRSSHIALEGRLVAREYARVICLEDGSYGIINQNHTIGVVINGHTLDWMELSPLRDGDLLQIGQTVLVFGSGRR